ncbi:MAG: MBL fold metallo-hydrolase [Syntrophaceticus schinkii]
MGKQVFSVLHTPGHTKGSISLKGDGVIFSGDTLFADSVGRTDFPGGSYQELVDSIKNKILPCGDDVIVYPGHGPATNVGHERVHNPFF